MSTITTVKARDALKPRREPYWHKLVAGAFLGWRKTAAGSDGTWVARYRNPDTLQQQYHALGAFDDLPAAQRFDAASAAATEWLQHMGRGGTGQKLTVKDACDAYVQHLRTTKGDGPADDAEARFRRWVHADQTLAGTALDKLRRAALDTWRQGLTKTAVKVNRDDRDVPVTRPRSASSVNRDCTALRAALNHALDMQHVTSDTAWRVVLRPTKNADGRREVYLDREQRRALLKHAAPDVGAFLRGLSLLPLRPGALAGLTVADFDKRLATLRIGKDKAGQDRRITLPPATAAFVTEQAKGKTPAAPLFARADGKAWDKDAWKKPVKAAAAAAELPDTTTAYALRHSTITDLVTAGLDLLTVAQLSGTSVVMIEKHYGHHQSKRAAEALAGLAL